MYIMDYFAAVIMGSCFSMPICIFLYQRITKNTVKKLRSKDLKELETLLPPFLDSISSSLAAGNSLQQSIESSVKKNRTILSIFFESVLIKIRSGMTLDASLEMHAADLPGCSLSLALISMASSYRSGSNTIESLTLLSQLCRERDSLRKKILARTAQARTQGYVIIFVPILFMALMFFISPQNMIPVFKTVLGRLLLLAAAVLQILGSVFIHTMVKQEIL